MKILYYAWAGLLAGLLESLLISAEALRTYPKILTPGREAAGTQSFFDKSLIKKVYFYMRKYHCVESWVKICFRFLVAIVFLFL